MSEQYQNGLPEERPDLGTCGEVDIEAKEDAGKMDQDIGTGTFALPKNIRQIGQPGEQNIVYIEDYVYTYLHLFLKEKCKGDTLRAAVLAGTVHMQGDKTCAFISSAMFCEFSALHMETQEDLLTALQEHFVGVVPLGWYIGCDGQDSHIQSVVKHYYAQMDAVVPGYLIYEDDASGNMDLFCWKQNAMHPMGGYYIYYEKNPQMQEFLIAEKRALRGDVGIENTTSDTGELPVRQMDDAQKSMSERIAKHYAQEEMVRFAGKKDKPSGKRPQRVVYAACAAALIVAAATGVSQIGNYQSLKNFQETVSRLAGNDAQATTGGISEGTAEINADTATATAQEQNANGADGTGVQTNTENGVPSTENNSGSDSGNGGNGTDTAASPAGGDGSAAQEQNGSDQPSETAQGTTGTNSDGTQGTIVASESAQSLIQTDANGARYYVVQKGDSLMSISRKLYQRTDRISEIRTMNNMQDTDLIYEGQKLLVP